MKVLITGAGGQVARALLDAVPAGIEAVGLARAECDLTDPGQCRTAVFAHQPDLLINAAAYTQVDRAESESALAFRVNASGPQILAEALADTAARLIQLSTDFVFDGASSRPYAPAAVPHPLSAYGASKLAGEDRVVAALPGRAIVLRTAWVYASSGSNFVRTMLRLMASRDSVSVVADQVGSPTWARSLAEAIWAIACQPVSKGMLHWTDLGVASWYDFAVAIQEEALERGLLQHAVPIEAIASAEYRRQFPATVDRPAFSVLECSETHTLLGKKPNHWRANLRTMLDELSA